MRSLFATAALLGIFTSAALYADYIINCEGYNAETTAHITGTCTNGHFDGNETHTGDKVYGDCSPGGELKGYDSKTGVSVYGDCESL